MLPPKHKVIYYIAAPWLGNDIKHTFSLSMKLPQITAIVFRIDELMERR
jgi:hypothetical protein